MKFENLRTERLLIRRFTSDDAEALSSYRSIPEVTRFQAAYSIERANQLVMEMSASDPIIPGKWFQFAIELTAEHRLIGDIGCFNADDDGRSWIGFTLDPCYWNRGYAAEAVRQVLAYYRQIGITKVWASTDSENENSMKLLRKLGFTLDDVKPDGMIFVLSGHGG